jgi:hypothetical protein
MIISAAFARASQRLCSLRPSPLPDQVAKSDEWRRNVEIRNASLGIGEQGHGIAKGENWNAMPCRTGHDSPEPFIAFEQPVERLQLTQIFRREWPPFALPNEPSEPFAQASRLNRDIVELSRHSLCPQRLERFGRHELRLLQPDRRRRRSSRFACPPGWQPNSGNPDPTRRQRISRAGVLKPSERSVGAEPWSSVRPPPQTA